MTYADIDGNTITEDFYFNMTKAELLKLELSEDEGFKAKIERIQKPDTKGREILEAFDSILRHAYGVRKDGKFVKTPQLFDEFLSSEAYSDLLFDLATNANKAAEFVKGLMPTSLMEEVEKEVSQVQDKTQPENVFEKAESNAEQMSDEELLAGLGLNKPKTETFVTAGLTDEQILALPDHELRTKPRAVLLRAFQLKNQR